MSKANQIGGIPIKVFEAGGEFEPLYPENLIRTEETPRMTMFNRSPDSLRKFKTSVRQTEDNVVLAGASATKVVREDPHREHAKTIQEKMQDIFEYTNAKVN